MTFLEGGRLVASNNLAEQAIKIVVIERKKYLFSKSLKGVEANAIDYTIIEIVKVSGLNAYKDLTNLPNLEFFIHPEHLEDFLPWEKSVQQTCR